MSTILIALPVPKETQEDMVRAFASEINSKRDEYVASRNALGVTLEAWGVQDLPDGSHLFLLALGGDDPLQANRKFAESQQAFDRWFKDNAGRLLKVDFNQPLPPISRTLFDWHA